ncbi:MAG: DUF763 domain-containing protein [Candidatus Pacearchaeota archaeon]
MKTGTVDLPLHYGNCPRWLFQRMVQLSRSISEIIVDEYGPEGFLKRLSDPYFFQSFGCAVGFDFHSSGITTTLCAALKEALRTSDLAKEIVFCGGKGKISRKTPEEIKTEAEKINIKDKKVEELVRASRLAAKVDNAALQDGFTLYHHSFVFTSRGSWAVIQQGMNQDWARRYHWLSYEELDFVREPHVAIACDIKVKPLNMIAYEAEEARKASVELAREKPSLIKKELKKIYKDQKKYQKTLDCFGSAFASFSMPYEHFPKIKNFKINLKALEKAYQEQPESYEELLLIQGLGPSTIRALALLSNLIYGSELSWRDPCKFAFAHGGKDGWPYPVNKKQYDKSITILKDAIDNAKIGKKEKLLALKRLSSLVQL